MCIWERTLFVIYLYHLLDKLEDVGLGEFFCLFFFFLTYHKWSILTVGYNIFFFSSLWCIRVIFFCETDILILPIRIISMNQFEKLEFIVIIVKNNFKIKAVRKFCNGGVEGGVHFLNMSAHLWCWNMLAQSNSSQL